MGREGRKGISRTCVRLAPAMMFRRGSGERIVFTENRYPEEKETPQIKVRFGESPKPAREAHALPRVASNQSGVTIRDFLKKRKSCGRSGRYSIDRPGERESGKRHLPPNHSLGYHFPGDPFQPRKRGSAKERPSAGRLTSWTLARYKPDDWLASLQACRQHRRGKK